MGLAVPPGFVAHLRARPPAIPLPRDASSPLALHCREIQGIYCLTFQVRSALAAADYLRGKGFALIAGQGSRFVINPQQAFGRLLYFTDEKLEGRPPFASLLGRPAQLPA